MVNEFHKKDTTEEINHSKILDHRQHPRYLWFIMIELMDEEYIWILNQAYQFFNKRDINNVLALMVDDVHWPNGWEGGYVNGKDEVKQYWTRQWQQVDPLVEPIGFKKLIDGRVQVNVHQVVRNLNGELIFDGQVNHVYRFENGLIAEMEIS